MLRMPAVERYITHHARPDDGDQHVRARARCIPQEEFVVVVRVGEAERAALVDGEEIIVDGHEVCVVLLHLPDDLVLVGVGELLQKIVRADVGEKQVVLRKARLGDLCLDQLEVFTCRPHKYSLRYQGSGQREALGLSMTTHRFEVRHGLVCTCFLEAFDQKDVTF